MNKNNLLTVLAGAIIIILVMAGIMYWLAEPEPEQPLVDPPRYIIPTFISVDGEPSLENNRIYFRDYSNVMHGISTIAQFSRKDDMGNVNYREGRFYNQMKDRAEAWLNLMAATNVYFSDYGEITSSFSKSGDFFKSDGKVDLADYPHGVLAYLMHHRGDWFTDFGVLPDQLHRLPASYISDPGRFLLSEHYRNGRFFHQDGTIDNSSMANGIGGIHGHFYAWVRWKKPGGAEDMGHLDAERLSGFLGHDAEALTKIARDIATVLDHSWDGPLGIYQFGSGNTWNTNDVGALLRGKKAIYDMLYMFGDENDKAMAKKLFDRSVNMYDRVEPLIKSWGLPSQIEFQIAKAVPASETVDLYAWYEFLNHMDGGYAWIRDREGTSNFFGKYNPEALNRTNQMLDKALLGALDYHMHNGRLVSTVSYADGSILDQRSRTSTIGMFITVAGNHYDNGTAFEPASKWNNASEEVVINTTRLYDTMASHIRELDLLLLLNE